MSEQLAETQQGMERFAKAVVKLGSALKLMAHQMNLAFARNEKLRRRLRRDYARANRRPALIHKGRKP